MLGGLESKCESINENKKIEQFIRKNIHKWIGNIEIGWSICWYLIIERLIK